MEGVLLQDFWVVAAHGGELARGKTLAKTVMGKQLLLGRTNDGEVFALLDFCPHRGIPLRYGSFDGNVVECCYHGWCFDKQGQCTKIPSLPDDDEKVDISRIKAGNFPAREHNNVIWVYISSSKQLPDPLPPLPTLPGPDHTPFYHVDSVSLPCNIDHAVIGLMDPAHGPFVHASWWWRGRKSMHLKQKQFEPTPLGFKMASHAPSTNSRAYKILGGKPATEISFQLPALRSEHITIGKHHIVLLTALTPVSDKETILHQFFYTTIPLVNAIKGLLKPFGKAFIAQDAKVVKMQQEGLREGHPSLMLLGDADQQALWYFKLKKQWLDAKAQGVPFENTLKAKTLRWKS